MPQPADKDLLTVNDVARKLSISQRTVWRWLAMGRLPEPIRYSATCIRWRAADIQRHIDSQPTAPAHA